MFTIFGHQILKVLFSKQAENISLNFEIKLEITKETLQKIGN